jgi:hypothetical protein
MKAMTTKSKSSSRKAAGARPRAAKRPRKPKSRQSSGLLATFAAEHRLKLSSWEQDGRQLPKIDLGDHVTVFDLYDDFVLNMYGQLDYLKSMILEGEDVLWSNTVKHFKEVHGGQRAEEEVRDRQRAEMDAKFLKGVSDRQLLGFSIMFEQNNILYEQIGFDVPSYDNGSGDPRDPNSSKWGKKLHRIGIDYLDGDDTGTSFSFPSNQPEAVEMVFKLALTTAP